MKNSRYAVILLVVIAVIVFVFVAVVPAVAPSQPTVVAQSEPTESTSTETPPSGNAPADSASTESAPTQEAAQSASEETSSSGDEAQTSNIDTIHRLEEAFNQDDNSVIGELFSPDFVGHMPENDLFGSTFDINVMTDLVSILPAALPNLHVESDMLIADGDLVAQRALISGDFEVEFFDYPATGSPVAFTANVFYRFDDSGLIIEQWIEFDTRAVLAQFGAE